ncbi:MAG: four helix bundle protein [Caldilineaceae bacterium]|nr:four helix bundle protein [Caldilineaceae bacterium]MBP8108518.1 four helix bundle protein [Caldilineaceae bacterium]MBP8123546.1 four helix bundle protein [Caldilineaceae bacterium]MBP9074386.1 four helix bundle protein [Caldilineaceae bacterium]
MAKGDELEKRLIDFGVRVIRLCHKLPKEAAGTHIGGQLLRSGTAPGAHYAEARGAESTRDFIHKLKIALKELNESRVWLTMIRDSELIPANRMDDLLTECDQLCRIISASIKTAKASQTNQQS